MFLQLFPIRFNSTTVQLILARTLAQAPIQRFQFHNGTINTTLFAGQFGKDVVSIPQRYN